MNARGQSMAEYALVIGIVVAGLTAMSTYIQRSVQAGVRWHADHILGYAGSDGTQARGLLNSGTTLAEFVTDGSSVQSLRRAALGGVVSYEAVQDERFVRSGFEQFTQIEGPPREGQQQSDAVTAAQTVKTIKKGQTVKTGLALMRGHRQGNVAGEWAILIAVVTAAFLALPILLKQSVAGHLQRSSDSVSPEPYYYERVEGQERLSVTASRRETVRTERLPGEPNKTIVSSIIGAVPCCAADPTCDPSCIEVTTRSRHAETLEDVYAPLFDR